jgi:hypothetical protein
MLAMQNHFGLRGKRKVYARFSRILAEQRKTVTKALFLLRPDEGGEAFLNQRVHADFCGAGQVRCLPGTGRRKGERSSVWCRRGMAWQHLNF